MSLATASMTDNAPTTRAVGSWPPAAAPLKHLSLNLPWQQDLSTADKLALSSSVCALQLPPQFASQLAPAAPALAQWGQPWGQPWGAPAQTMAQAYGAWPAAPSVDMLVLPSASATTAPAADRQQDVVKVSYTSAEDLAEVLFPTSSSASDTVSEQLERHGADIHDLSTHSELVHEALLDHRDNVHNLRKSMEHVHTTLKTTDVGLLDHKKHIQELKSSHSNALRQLNAHSQQLTEMKSEIKTLVASNKAMDLGLKAHTSVFDQHNEAIQALSTKQSAVAAEVASLSKTLRSATPQDQDRQRQIKQLEKTMIETQAQLARLTAPAATTTLTIDGPRVMRKP